MRKLWITCLLMLLTLPALAEEPLTEGEWVYQVDYYGWAQLTDWRWEELDAIPAVVEVPAQIGGHKVTDVAEGAFTTEGVGGFTIVLPDSVTAIYGGFEDCGASQIVLGSRMYSVREGSFAGCEAEVVLPADGQHVFQREGFLFSGSEERATLLYVNPSQRGQHLPALTGVGHRALDNWVDGSDFTLPDTVERIGWHEYFVPCQNPDVIRTAWSGDHLWEYRETWQGEAILTGWLTKYDDISSVLTVPQTLDGLPVTGLGDNLFNTSESYFGEGFTLVIPYGVRTIEGDPFMCCHDVQRIDLPATLVGNLEGCFHHVYAEVTVAPGNPRYTVQDGWLIDQKNDTLVYMSPSAASADIPAVRRIGTGALSNWRSDEAMIDQVLATGVGAPLVLPEGVEELASFCMYNNCGVTEVVFPTTLKTVEWNAFGTSLLEENPPDIPAGVLRFDEDGEWGYTVDAEGNATLIQWDWETLYEIPDTVEVPATLGGHPVTRVSGWAFDTLGMDSEGFTLILPEGVTVVTDGGFGCLHDVTALHLPATLTDIEGEEGSMGEFYHVSAEITVAAGNPRYAVRDGYLIDTWTETLLYAAPSTNWQPLPAVKHYGVNCLENWGWTDPWPEAGEGGTLVIPEGVETLAHRTLYDNVCISKVILPDSLTKMESATFESCTVEEVQFGSGLTEIPAFAFYYCFGPGKSPVTLPESVTFVGFYAFDPDFTQVTALNPNCHFETEEEYRLRVGDDDTYWW